MVSKWLSESKEWQARASAFLKAKMKETGITYVGLVKRLKKHGFA
jgi:Domain of unknown function (DUF6471)